MKTSSKLDSNKEPNKEIYFSESFDMLSINNLSKEEKKSYEIKKDLINLKGFVDMRILTKEELLREYLAAKKYSLEETQQIVKSLKVNQEDRNKVINKLLMKDILLPKIEKTYIELKTR